MCKGVGLGFWKPKLEHVFNFNTQNQVYETQNKRTLKNFLEQKNCLGTYWNESW